MPETSASGEEVAEGAEPEGLPWGPDQACYAFLVAEYAKSLTCFTVDLRGAGLSGKPEGTFTTELLADDVAAFMQAAGVKRAHVSGLSLGAATGMWLAARYPDRVKSVSLHSARPCTNPFLNAVVEGWQIMPQASTDTRYAVPAVGCAVHRGHGSGRPGT